MIEIVCGLSLISVFLYSASRKRYRPKGFVEAWAGIVGFAFFCRCLLLAPSYVSDLLLYIPITVVIVVGIASFALLLRNTHSNAIDEGLAFLCGLVFVRSCYPQIDVD